MRLRALLKTEWRLMYRDLSDALMPFLFLTLALMLCVFGIGGSKQELMRVAPNMLWVIILLTNLITIPHIFREDARVGMLEVYQMSLGCPMTLIVGKFCIHFLSVNLPLLLFSYPLFHLLQGDTAIWGNLLTTLLLGTPILSCYVVFAATLTLGSAHRMALGMIITLPLLTPLMMLATSLISAARLGMETTPYILFLSAYGLLSILIALWGGIWALKASPVNT